ncbi:hypothetical protein Acr_00g0100460 [Actinidia rufa]|uniref:Uncharacterized protein n=1 Tax=Actinidia rufa TaxID=165716 RepID=A0A7J0DZW7_9ERIC|nr:hypothetical protein Acr_00g0100460 [Actinidia rufa]
MLPMSRSKCGGDQRKPHHASHLLSPDVPWDRQRPLRLDRDPTQRPTELAIKRQPGDGACPSSVRAGLPVHGRPFTVQVVISLYYSATCQGLIRSKFGLGKGAGGPTYPSGLFGVVWWKCAAIKLPDVHT